MGDQENIPHLTGSDRLAESGDKVDCSDKVRTSDCPERDCIELRQFFVEIPTILSIEYRKQTLRACKDQRHMVHSHKRVNVFKRNILI